MAATSEHPHHRPSLARPGTRPTSNAGCSWLGASAEREAGAGNRSPRLAEVTAASGLAAGGKRLRPVMCVMPLQPAEKPR